MKWVSTCILLSIIFEFSDKSVALNIAIIGAGAAGLASAKNAIEQGHNVVIFEKTGVLGGVWYYTDKTGKDEYDIDIHTPMYYKLSTNTFYKDMEFPRFHFPSGTEMFPTHDVVWKYLDSYAKSFNLTVHIKYHHLVQKVLAIPDEKWKISVRNLPINRNEKSLFDAVFVCSGINSSPRIPKIKGVTEFKGKIMHSRSYRKPDKFNGECVLVIGSGPSGKDIVDQLLEAGTVNRLTHSYQMPISKEPPKENKFMGKARALCASCFIGKKKNLQSTQESAFTVKGEVKRFTKYGVEFQDGSLQNYTVVIYATGYRYSYPFLDKNTGIHVKDYSVEPLYKHILNIKHTTMAFIGVLSKPVMCELHFTGGGDFSKTKNSLI